MRTCPCCTAPVPPAHLMCLVHWRRVPNPLRDDLYSALRAYKATSPGKTPDAEFKALRRKMQLAQLACIAAVRGQKEEA